MGSVVIPFHLILYWYQTLTHQVHFYLVKDILVLTVKGMWKDNFEIAFWNWPDAMCIYFKHHFVMQAILKDTTLIKFSSANVDPTSQLENDTQLHGPLTGYAMPSVMQHHTHSFRRI